MSDLGIWRLDNGNFVIRIHGSEHLMTKDECHDLCYHVRMVLEGAAESLADGYKALRIENAEDRKPTNRPKISLTGVRDALGVGVRFRRI